MEQFVRVPQVQIHDEMYHGPRREIHYKSRKMIKQTAVYVPQVQIDPNIAEAPSVERIAVLPQVQDAEQFVRCKLVVEVPLGYPRAPLRASVGSSRGLSDAQVAASST